MEARMCTTTRKVGRSLLVVALLLGSTGLVSFDSAPAQAASFRTQNFLCEAPTAEQARRFCEAAERYRHDLAVEWLGKPLPAWQSPCPITCQVGPRMGAGGATSFIFQNGGVHGWRMSVQGSEERILDSVLPHEVTHTIFASHFRQPLPRWADEGACTTVEHPSEKARHQELLITFLKTNRGIPFDRMFAMKEYPSDILPLYAQGHSVARFLIAQGGQRAFLKFVGDGMVDENWKRALDENYGYRDLGTLQSVWIDWVRAGSPADVQSPIQLAAARRNEPAARPEASVTFASDSTNRGELASDQRFADATEADTSPLTYAPRGVSPARSEQPARSASASRSDSPLPWRRPEARVASGDRTERPLPAEGIRPGDSQRSIYQAVRPQPLVPAEQRIIE